MQKIWWKQLVHYNHALVETRFFVQLAVLLFHQAKRLKGNVFDRNDLKRLEAHAQEDIIDGVELQGVCHPVKSSC